MNVSEETIERAISRQRSITITLPREAWEVMIAPDRYLSPDERVELRHAKKVIRDELRHDRQRFELIERERRSNNPTKCIDVSANGGDARC